jgi:hypothetical protein
VVPEKIVTRRNEKMADADRRVCHRGQEHQMQRFSRTQKSLRIVRDVVASILTAAK